MRSIQIFNNPEFGDIRTVDLNGEPWFVGKDFTQAVEYIQRWKPSTNSVMLIQQTNAQTSLYE